MAARLTTPLLLGVALSLSATLLTQQASAQQRTELQLEVGQQRVLSSDGVGSYSEGTPGIADVRLTEDGSQFIVVGKRDGRTTLLLMLEQGGERHYDVVVGTGEAAKPSSGGALDYGPGTVSARDNIRLDFYFVQLSKDYRHQLGVAWPDAAGGATLGASFDLTSGAFTDATAVVTDQALPRLDMAQSNGWAKLLRQAAVITANGSEANFAGGGEVNVPVSGALSASIRQIEFGSKIRVKPRYDRDSGRIELTIHADVSDLSSDNGTGVPGRITSTLDSVVNLELGQSLVLAGLTARSEGSSQAGLPGLSQVPILGALFGTHGNRSEEVENVIFIVPTVVDAVSLSARERIREALRQFREFDGAGLEPFVPEAPATGEAKP